jgi:hypothetical protein
MIIKELKYQNKLYFVYFRFYFIKFFFEIYEFNYN